MAVDFLARPQVLDMTVPTSVHYNNYTQHVCTCREGGGRGEGLRTSAVSPMTIGVSSVGWSVNEVRSLFGTAPEVLVVREDPAAG